MGASVLIPGDKANHVDSGSGFPSQRGKILLRRGSSMGETLRKFDRDFQ
jgi:hypothetical protein